VLCGTPFGAGIPVLKNKRILNKIQQMKENIDKLQKRYDSKLQEI